MDVIDKHWIDSAADESLPDVMVGVRCLSCGGDLDTGWECVKCGADHAPAARAAAAQPEAPPAPRPGTPEYYDFLHRVLVSAFKHLLDKGYDAVEINAAAIGMCRRSMETLVGKEAAIEWDRMARERAGWGKARIIYPPQHVRGRRS